MVGVVGDAEILRCKGPPVLDEGERTCLVEAIKWVDQIIPNVPYDLSPHFIQELFSKHRIDYIVHGDDPCLLPDGSDAYAHAKKLGRFLMIKRTEGVSTTDIVGRMLTCTRSNRWMQAAGEAGQDGSEGSHPLSRAFSESVDDQDHGIMPVPAGSSPSGDSPRSSSASGAAAGERPSGSTPNNQRTTLSRFLPTSRRLVQFSNGRQAPEGARIVYIDGAWDVFHPGHVRILAAARQQGDFLLVGIHGDGEVMARRGPHLPILNVHERALSVLACKWVDEVVIGAPSVITPDLIKTFNISLVLRGSVSETSCRDRGVSPERYAVPAQRGIFRQMASPSGITAAAVITRIVAKREQFEAKQARKEKSEAAYYTDSKSYVSEL